MAGPFVKAVTEAIEFAERNRANEHGYKFMVDTWKVDLNHINEKLGSAAYRNDLVDVKEWRK